jgi:hypothetical protein
VGVTLLSLTGIKAVEDLEVNESRSRLKYWIETLNHESAEKRKSGVVCHDTVDVTNPCLACLSYHLDAAASTLLMSYYSRNK